MSVESDLRSHYMTTARRWAFGLMSFMLAVSAICPARAQFLKDLKKVANDKVRELTTKENLNKATNSLLKSMENARAEFDSTDFDYAILISDNAGLFDVKEKGER